MMGWFKRKKALDATGEAQAQKIASSILAYQHKIADSLNAKAKKWNRKTFMVILIGFVVAFGCYCLWLVTGLFR